MGNPEGAQHVAETVRSREKEYQFIHLMRLAWDLRELGLRVSVELSRWEPCLVVYRAVGPLRVTAARRDDRWVFAWGRGRDCWGPALDTEVAHRIRQVAR